MLVGTEKPEELVFDYRTTDASAKLVALVLREKRHEGAVDKMLLKWIDSAEIRATQIPKRIAVDLVRATFGHGINDTPGGAAVFSRIIRSINLKFLYRGLACGIANARTAALLAKKRLVVVRTIHGVVVQQTRNAAEAD